MNKSILTFLTACAMFLSVQIHAQENTCYEIDGKCYVDPSNLFIISEGLFFKNQDELIQLRSISVDEMGIFINPFETLIYCLKCTNWYDPDEGPHVCRN